MKCKACGHLNRTTSMKCAACGQELGPNEYVQMFQAQAQSSKGVAINIDETKEVTHTKNSPVDAEAFFSELNSNPGSPPNPPPKAPIPPPLARPDPPKEPEKTFFQKAENVKDLVFDTKVERLVEEPEKPLPEHPLYSPPTNPTIENFIVKRNSSKK